MLRSVNGLRLWVQDVGEGEVICFSHGLLWSAQMYDAQVAALKGEYRCVAWDHRGQGRSDGPDGDEASIEDCTADAIALIESLDVGAVHFVGLSMGGFVGMRIAARRPELVRSLALLGTAADPEPSANVGKYGRMNLAVRYVGVQSWLADRVMPIMFGASFLADPDNVGAVREQRRRLRGNDNSIYKAVNGVVRRGSVEAELQHIRCPTLVLWGTEDAAIARERAQALANGIGGAVWVEVPGAGHSSSVEQPDAVTAALRAHLARAS